uniref:C2 domain-containing protein n=1 Tax=Panagrellus redivivus TaxID=6233 RepID=A0A7E4UZC7_PANRE
MTTMAYLSILLLLSITQISLASNFWIVTKVTGLEFNDECLAKTCFLNALRFRVSHSIPTLDEFSLTEWPARSIEDEKQFTSAWIDGLPEDVQTQLSVINYDPSFGFPRVCDSSAKVSLVNATQSSGSTGSDENVKVFQLQGRCFNATLVLQKHEEKCPWCEDPVIGDQQMVLQNMPFFDRLSDPLYLWPIIAAIFLALLVFFLTLTLICVLAFKSSVSEKSSKDRYNCELINSSSSSEGSSGSFIHDCHFMRQPVPRYPVPQVPTTIDIPEHDYETLLPHGIPRHWNSTSTATTTASSYIPTPSPSIIDV